MQHHVERKYKHFQPIHITIIFESLQEVDNFVAHNEDEYPELCEELEKFTG